MGDAANGRFAIDWPIRGYGMNIRGHDERDLGFWNRLKTRLEPVGFVIVVSGILVLVTAVTAPITTGLQTNLLGISLALFSVGLGLIAIGISAKSDIRYTEILSRIEANLTRVLEFFEPGRDELDLPSDLSKSVVIKPRVTAAHTDVAARVEVMTPEQSKAQAQARLDADKKRVGYRRGQLFEKEDGSWAVRWGGRYPL